jgi:hypothetical protein
MLAVRVTATDYAPAYTPEQISDDLFGTINDPNNMVTQFYDCSWGQLDIKTGPRDNTDISQHEVAPGVIEVNIDIPLAGNSRATIRNAVTTAVQSKLGFNLPGPFDHVLYILQGCYVDCGWAAYAYINSWNSVFQGRYHTYTGVQVHEIGKSF